MKTQCDLILHFHLAVNKILFKWYVNDCTNEYALGLNVYCLFYLGYYDIGCVYFFLHLV